MKTNRKKLDSGSVPGAPLVWLRVDGLAVFIRIFPFRHSYAQSLLIAGIATLLPLKAWAPYTLISEQTHLGRLG